MAHLSGRLLPTPDDPSSNPAALQSSIDSLITVNWEPRKDEIKKRQGMANLKNINNTFLKH